MDQENDQIYWKGNASGCFKISEAWDWIRQKRNKEPTRTFIWSSRIPLKISFFLWRLLHCWVPTHDVLKGCRISLASKCSFCDSEETMNHLFLNCYYASEIWAFFEQMLCIFPQHRRTVHSKIHSWWNMKFKSVDKEVLNLLLCLILWEIWKSRNTYLHEGKKLPTKIIIDRILSSMSLISAGKPYTAITPSLSRILKIHSQPIRTKNCHSIFWSPPATNRVKLNVDGSSLGNPGISGGGGIIRNYLGIPLFGFSSYYGTLSSLSAECRALSEGVQLCLHHGFSSVDVEIDSLQLCQMIAGRNKIAWNVDSDIRKIQHLTAAHNFTFKHIYREANSVSDSLATQGSSSKNSYIFDRLTIPQFIKGKVALDAIQFPYLRVH